jgi:prepilin signal peptidase PulO-like enzyme (type II secretory pathway)
VNAHTILSFLLLLVVGGIVGLISASLVGHFGWRAAERLPGENRRPYCLFCLQPLTLDEITPFFGWIFRPDRFSFPCPCGERRGLWMQPAIEGIGFLSGLLAAMALAASHVNSPLGMLVPLAFGLGLLPSIALIDIHFGIIPDELNLLIALDGILWLLLGGGDFYLGMMTAAILLGLGLFLALVYSRWRGREMLGLGDVKFFAAAGLWLRPDTAAWFLAIAGLCGVVTSYLWKRAGGDKELPFAPGLCFALALCIFYQIFMQ